MSLVLKTHARFPSKICVQLINATDPGHTALRCMVAQQQEPDPDRHLPAAVQGADLEQGSLHRQAEQCE